MATAIHWAQILAFGVWLLPFWLFSGSLWRVIRKHPRRFDTLKGGIWWTAAAIQAFNLRWLIWGGIAQVDPESFPLWLTAYVLSVTAALWICAAVHEASDGA